MFGFCGAPGRRHDGVAEPGEERDRHAADATIGSGHQNLTVPGLDSVLFESQHAEHRGVAGGADCHRLAGREGGGQRHQPFAPDPRHLGQTATMRFADAPAVQHDAVAHLPGRIRTLADSAGKIDARHHRKAPDDRRLAGQRQAVLVVERTPFDPDRDVARGQHGIVDLLNGGVVTGFILGDQDSLEHGDSPLLGNRV